LRHISHQASSSKLTELETRADKKPAKQAEEEEADERLDAADVAPQRPQAIDWLEEFLTRERT
jgi:hypothetical protein